MIRTSSLTFDHATDSGSENLGDQTTASISPGSNSLVLAFIGENKPSTTPNIPTLTGLSMTWTQSSTETVDSQFRITCFRGVSNGNSGALTIGVGGQNQKNIYWGIVELDFITKSGTNGGDALVQVGVGSGNTTTTPSVSLSSFLSPANATIGAIYYNTSNGVTPGTGFTEINNATSAHVIEVEFAQTNQTTVPWTLAGNSNYVAVAFELKTLLEGMLLSDI